MRPEGANGRLFEEDSIAGKHFISLWNHENLLPVIFKGKAFLSVNAPGWQSSFSGTRKEGSVDCVAELPDLIKSKFIGDSIKLSGIEDKDY